MVKIISNVEHEVFVDVLTEKGLVKEKLLPGKFTFSEKVTDSVNNLKRKRIVQVKTVSKAAMVDSSQEVTTSKVTKEEKTASSNKEAALAPKTETKSTTTKSAKKGKSAKDDSSSEELYHIDMKGGEE